MNKRIVLLIFILSTIAFLESSIPYYYAQKKCSKDNVFLGQVISTLDQNMYFSFINQAADGHFLFKNKLTYLPNQPVFINLEFWLVGFMKRVTNLSVNNVYTLWRYLGVLALSISIVLLTNLLFHSFYKVVLASLLFLFTGGVGFVYALLLYLGLLKTGASALAVFTNYTGTGFALDSATNLLPFNQMIANPHLSLPTGIILLGYYFYLYAETKGKVKYYWFSGIIMFLIGLIRPYDIIPVFIIFPVFLLLGIRGMTQKNIALKLMPVCFALPVLIYNVWLFRYNDIFRYWSSQGNTAIIIPPFYIHYINYGIIGVLALIRVAYYKRMPIKTSEQFLMVLFVVSFILKQSGAYFSTLCWSFQIGSYLAAPLVLLGCGIDLGKLNFAKSKIRAIIGCIGLIAIASNIIIVVWHCKFLSNTENKTHAYVDKNEYQALQWLKYNTVTDNVVLSSMYSSSRIAKYTNLSVVIGHPYVSPNYKFIKEIAQHIVYDSMPGLNQRAELEQLKVDYIYIGPLEKRDKNYQLDSSGYVTEVYKNNMVVIYKVNR